MEHKIQTETAMIAQVDQQIQQVLSDLEGAKKYVQDGQYEHPNRTDQVLKPSVSFKWNHRPDPSMQQHLPAARFGQPSQLAPSVSSGSTFGQPSTFGAPKSAFGAPSSLGTSTAAFGTPSTMGATQTSFGAPSALGNSGGFGRPTVSSTNNGSTALAAPAFGQPSAFGQPLAFGKPSALGGSTSTFGQSSTQPQTTSPFGGVANAASGAPNQIPAASGFSQPSSAAGFGQPSTVSGFGKASPFTQSAISINVPQSTATAFGQPSQPSHPNNTGNGFGQPSRSGTAANQPSPFAAPTATATATLAPNRNQAPGFGRPSPFGSNTGPGNNGGTSSAFGQTTFGQSSAPAAAANYSPFGQQQRQPLPSGPFGASGPPLANGTGGLYPTFVDPKTNLTFYRIPNPSPDEPNRTRLQRVWFPDGPPASATAPPDAFEADPKTYSGGAAAALETVYCVVRETGSFPTDQAGGLMPEVPPKREWIGWDL